MSHVWYNIATNRIVVITLNSKNKWSDFFPKPRKYHYYVGEL